MARYLHSIAVNSRVVVVDTVDRFDLPVNPLSHLLIRLNFLNNGINTKATMGNIAAAIDRLEVLFKGNAVLSLNGSDMLAYGSLINGHGLRQSNVVNTDNAVRSYTILVPFGRRLFNPTECFPATDRGNLQLSIDWATALTNLDTITVQIEAVELPEARPQQFMRATTLSLTPTATGDQDIQIPVGNILRAIMIFGTTIPTGIITTATIGNTRLLADGNSIYVDQIGHEVLHALWGLGRDLADDYDDHIHLENTAAAYTQNADTAAAEQDDGFLSQYSLIDFDPTGDGMYLFNSAGLGELKVRINAGNTSALRVLPIELVKVAA